MTSKYVDSIAITQVIGCVYNSPQLLDFTDKYTITEEDFSDIFHQVVFGAIYKIHELGAEKITLENILDFLSTRPKYEGIFNANKGEEWLLKVSENAKPLSFDYYYARLKKFSLLRAYDKFGIDISFIYDPDNILDAEKKQAQEEELDNSTLEHLAQLVDDKIEQIKYEYVNAVEGASVQAGDGIFKLIDNLKEHPEVGSPLYGPLVNTITRGARLRKLYLRSAATGTGKTRSMIADACYLACDHYYHEQFGWITNGVKEPVFYITTEQDKNEIQTMMLAFLSNVNEEHILNGEYLEGEEDRVRRAAKELTEAPLYIRELPDFSLQDIENEIKKAIRDLDVKYVALDYLHTSMKILEEITKRSGGVKLREDNILFMLSNKLKDICNNYGIFIITATQLNGSYVEGEVFDQNLLRGAKSIADKIDCGMILLSVTDEDLIKLDKIITSNVFQPPNIKMSIYKNRRGRYKGIFLWCKADLGVCRIEPMFATTYGYELIPLSDLKIQVQEEESAF